MAWANRCHHEASSWEHNSFLTLTYADEHLPKDGHLIPRDLTLFLKRLRKHSRTPSSVVRRDPMGGIRYFGCGEYGDRHNRPHYHLLLFNYGVTDTTRISNEAYISDLIARIWGQGHHEIAPFDPARGGANYIAQYTMKKIGSGDFDPATGECRPAPFLRMSLRPAIGRTWLDKYASDLRHGYLVSKRGAKQAIPRYYRTILKDTRPELYEEIETNLQQNRLTGTGDKKDPERIKAAEIIHQRRKELTESRHL